MGPTHPVCSGEYWVSLPLVKWPVREVDHSPPSSARLKNEGSCLSVLPIYFHGVDRSDSLYFFLNLHLRIISRSINDYF